MPACLRRARRPALRSSAGSWSERGPSGPLWRTAEVSSDTGGHLPGDVDLGRERGPDAAVDVDELGGDPELLDVTRPRQADVVDGLDAGGRRGHDDDPVGEHDRLF